ncbi:MAG: PilZ domain-containing protein [Phycisphaerae bacterium]
MAGQAYNIIARKILNRKQQEKRAESQPPDPQQPQADTCDKRRHQRHLYHCPKGVGLEIKHLGGGITKHTVHPLNISDGGLSYQLNQFIPPGSACKVTLTDKHGQFVQVEGSILGCRCVQGRLHDIGVQFAESIDATQFSITEEDQKAATAAMAAGTSSDYDREAIVTLNRQLWEQAVNQAPVGELRFTVQKLQDLLR